MAEAKTLEPVARAAQKHNHAVLGLIQLSEYRKQRRDVMAAELMRTFYGIDFADAVALIRTLPDHGTAAEIRQRGPQYELVVHWPGA